MERIKFNANSPNALFGVAAGCFLASAFCFGMATGYVVARRSLAKDFNDRLTAEVEAVKQHYKERYDESQIADDQILRRFIAAEERRAALVARETRDLAGPGADHEDDGETAVGDPDAAGDGIAHEDRPDGYIHLAEHEERPLDPSDVVGDGGLEATEPERPRNTDRPYGIGLEEFCDPPEGYQQITITYYAADKVLLDDHQSPIPDIVKTVGPLSALDFGGISKDPHIRYVRNEGLEADFEIILNSGAYVDEILNYGRGDVRQEDGDLQ
jgi:hypothetical protein